MACPASSLSYRTDAKARGIAVYFQNISGEQHKRKKIPSLKKAILSLSILFVLAACRSPLPEEFMGGHDVGSGDYYLLAEGYSLLLDDPQLLQQHKNDIRVKKRKKRPLSSCDFMPFCSLPPLSIKEAGDNTLLLMHREKGLVRQMEFHETYDMPDALRQSAKRIKAREEWTNKEEFLKRLHLLQSIEGVSIEEHARIMPYDYLINIYFPLRVMPFSDEVSAKDLMQDLIERLDREMQEIGIHDYQISYKLHDRISNSEGYIFLSHHYLKDKDIDRATYEDFPKINGYHADRFGLQINCNAECVGVIDSLQPLSWLPPGKVNHEVFMDMLKTAAEQTGLTFNPEFTVSIGGEHFPDRPDGYWENAHKYHVSGQVQIFKNGDWNKNPRRLNIFWKYDLERALKYPYPKELGQP